MLIVVDCRCDVVHARLGDEIRMGRLDGVDNRRLRAKLGGNGNEVREAREVRRMAKRAHGKI